MANLEKTYHGLQRLNESESEVQVLEKRQRVFGGRSCQGSDICLRILLEFNPIQLSFSVIKA